MVERVHDRQRDAVALLGDALVLGDAGRVDGERRVDRDGDVRLGGVGGGAGAAAADFLLHRRGEDHLVLAAFVRLAHRLDRDERRHAVVEALAADAVADLGELLHQRDRVADADLLSSPPRPAGRGRRRSR